jgi:hypothetical protein
MINLSVITGNPDQAILYGGLFLFIVILTVWHLQKGTSFDIQDLLVDSVSGKVELGKLGQLTALLVSSWILMHETHAGRLTEFLFIGYMSVWGGVNLARKYIDTKVGSDSINKPSE